VQYDYVLAHIETLFNALKSFDSNIFQPLKLHLDDQNFSKMLIPKV
jgi:hypothetical protein